MTLKSICDSDGTSLVPLKHMVAKMFSALTDSNRYFKTSFSTLYSIIQIFSVKYFTISFAHNGQDLIFVFKKYFENSRFI